MLYESTRGKSQAVPSSVAIKLGIAPDGGLFVPVQFVNLSREMLTSLVKLNYHQRAVAILQLYLTDFTPEEIRNCVSKAYSKEKFDPGIVPVRKLSNSLFVLELWHGPTCAFKDMALQILPQLLPLAMAKTGENYQIAILVATSGDTGKAALEGFRDVPGTRIIVFYPAGGVSEMQRLQMVTSQGDNVHVVAVQGNFDHTQSEVKEIFSDKTFNKEIGDWGYRFSSANSINWGRLVPQVVYYFSAYLDLVASGEITLGQEINFIVPTGNFGNILAAFYARQMGLPVARLICAANQNNVLTEFINSGVYNRNRTFYRTISPSMDILISSNLERLLYELTDRDGERVSYWMSGLKEKGFYRVDGKIHNYIQEIFWSDFASEEETLKVIKKTYETYGYLLDPHTAVGKQVYDKYVSSTKDRRPAILAATASPFKFNASVARALLGSREVADKNEFELLEVLTQTTGEPIPRALHNLDKQPIRHNITVAPAQMKEIVKKILI